MVPKPLQKLGGDSPLCPHLVILIDIGSTHNFLDAGLCSSLKLAIDPTLAFDVKIANGATLRTLGAWQDLQVQVQGHHFCMDLNVLPLDVIWFWALNGSEHWN